MRSCDSSKSPWRLVDARVHLSLSPQQLSDPVHHATRVAFNFLLMRYNASLRGVVVAHDGPLKLLSPPTFIGASPYAHLKASVPLLLFAPERGAILLGVVSHIGPDHVGLSVFSSFHAILAVERVSDIYSFESYAFPRRWRSLKEDVEDLTMGRQVRFVVESTKPSRNGLFQIIASLDDSVRGDGVDTSEPLGVVSSEDEIPFSYQQDAFGVGNDDDDDDEPSTDVLDVSIRKNHGVSSGMRNMDQSLLGDAGLFGDTLMADIPLGRTAPTPNTYTNKRPRYLDVPVEGDTGNEHGVRDNNHLKTEPLTQDGEHHMTSRSPIAKTPANMSQKSEELSLNEGIEPLKLDATPRKKERSAGKSSKKKKKKRRSEGELEPEVRLKTSGKKKEKRRKERHAEGDTERSGRKKHKKDKVLDPSQSLDPADGESISDRKKKKKKKKRDKHRKERDDPTIFEQESAAQKNGEASNDEPVEPKVEVMREAPQALELTGVSLANRENGNGIHDNKVGVEVANSENATGTGDETKTEGIMHRNSMLTDAIEAFRAGVRAVTGFSEHVKREKEFVEVGGKEDDGVPVKTQTSVLTNTKEEGLLEQARGAGNLAHAEDLNESSKKKKKRRRESSGDGGDDKPRKKKRKKRDKTRKEKRESQETFEFDRRRSIGGQSLTDAVSRGLTSNLKRRQSEG